MENKMSTLHSETLERFHAQREKRWYQKRNAKMKEEAKLARKSELKETLTTIGIAVAGLMVGVAGLIILFAAGLWFGVIG